MTSRKSLQYFLSRSLQEREVHKNDKVRLAQERLKEHIVFCPAKFCKVYEVYRKEKKDEDAIDYTCCPPDIKRSMERDELPCPCQEVTCDCNAHQLSNPFQPIPVQPFHPKYQGRVLTPPPLGCTCNQQHPFMYHDTSYDRQLNYSHNQHQDDHLLFNMGLEPSEEESPYFLKDLPVPECMCHIDGCTCRGVCWDKCGVPPLYHNCGGPKAICRNAKCPNLQEFIKNPNCALRVRKKLKRIPACVKEDSNISPINSKSIKYCRFKKKFDESLYLPIPCPIHGTRKLT